MDEPRLPTGTVTFLFTDIAGSTARWEANPAAMQEALEIHDDLARRIIEHRGGYVFKTVGDQFCAAFDDPGGAVMAGIEIQTELARRSWPSGLDPLQVRAAVHTGVAEHRSDDYFGPPVNRVARVLAAGHPGQLLLTATTEALVRQSLSSARLDDLGEHRLKDLLEPTHLYQVTMDGLPSDFPPLRSLNTDATWLPIQTSTFVGRQTELADLRALLDASRLITLVGPGGTGKTRLALQAAAEAEDRYDVRAFVDLSPFSDASHVLLAAARKIGLEGGEEPLELLRRRLGSAPSLIVFDNFEHVIDAAPRIAELVRAVPGVTALVTSRELLRLSGEQAYPVAPLSVARDESQWRDDPGAAVALFIDRARSVSPDLEIDESNLDDIVAMCRRLDGLPLAIELAAAQVRHLPLEALRQRLDRGLDALGTGPRDAPERQQTIEQTIRWSHDLLSPEGQRLLRCTGVFAGGFTVDAADAVCCGGGSSAPQLDALVDKSLVFFQKGLDGQLRYETLELIRAFAREELERTGELTVARRRHSVYYAELVSELAPLVRSGEQTRVMGRLTDETPNVRRAIEWAFSDDGEATVGLEIIAGLGDFAFYRGHPADMEHWLTLAKPHTAAADPALQAGLGVASGLHHYRNNDLPAAGDEFRRAVEVFRDVGDLRRAALGHIWQAATHMDDPAFYEEAQSIAEEAVAMSLELDDLAVQAQALNMLGEIMRSQGDYEAATEIQERALDTARRGNEEYRICMLLHNLAMMALAEGDQVRAAHQYREGLSYTLRLGWSDMVAHYLAALPEMALVRGHEEAASRLIGASHALWQRLGRGPQNVDLPDYERIEARVRAEVPRDVLERGLAFGATMLEAEAAELALSILG